MNNKTVRWGIVTTGRITHTFIKDIALVNNAEVVAVAARSGANAKIFAETYGIPNAYEGYDKLFSDPNVDAVYIASPHTLHIQQAVSALQAGKHVLCEKPVTTSVNDLNLLISIAKQNNCFFMEAMWTYFLPAIQRAQRWVEEGRIGKLLHVRADFGYPIEYDSNRREYDYELAGGCLYEMGIYPIALNYLFHKAFVQPTITKYSHAPNGAEDDVVWHIDYGDSHASLHTSFKAKLPNVAHIIGTEGHIVIDEFFRTKQATLFVLDDEVDSFTDNRLGSGFEFQIAHACDCISRGTTQSDVVTFDASLHFQRMISALRIPDSQSQNI